jgi:hypothetical protein
MPHGDQDALVSRVMALPQPLNVKRNLPPLSRWMVRYLTPKSPCRPSKNGSPRPKKRMTQQAGDLGDRTLA